jgi:hypothetical protein
MLSLEHQVYNKFLRIKPDFNWHEPMIKEELFTADVALMMADTDTNQMAAHYNIHCDIFINPPKYLTDSAIAFAFQKDFALKEIIDHQLLKFKQTGLLKKLSMQYFKDFPRHCEPPVRELSFRATFITFAILATGVLTAFCSLVVEKMIFMIVSRR